MNQLRMNPLVNSNFPPPKKLVQVLSRQEKVELAAAKKVWTTKSQLYLTLIAIVAGRFSKYLGLGLLMNSNGMYVCKSQNLKGETSNQFNYMSCTIFSIQAPVIY